MIKKLTYLISGVLAVFAFSLTTNAATLNLVADRDTFPVNEDFKLDIKINSEGESINGAQATLQFDPSIIEVKSADRSESIFDFWLDEPEISNTEGTVSFIGASTTGYIGGSLQVLSITLRAKGPGSTNLSFTDAAITAADGGGTNVLTGTNGLTINFFVGASSTTVGKPVQIVRTPEPAVGLPEKPVIEVPLYPDPTKWNNVSARFFARWELPGDITQVAAFINRSPETLPTIPEGLFEEKSFPPLSDGTHYLHVRFRNAIGWGPALHYRIAVDTTPPEAFLITFRDAPSSNPKPVITYKSIDTLSGLDYYEIRVDGGQIAQTKVELFELGPLAPGANTVSVRAFDVAGNASQDSVEFEIFPIASPTITSVSRDVFTGEGNLFVSGTSMPGWKINVSVISASGTIDFAGSTTASESGIWTMNVSQPLRTGNYYVEAVAEDERGALSEPVRSDTFRVSPRPLFAIGSFGVTPLMLIIFLMALALVIAGIGIMTYRSKSLTVARRVIIAQRDVATMANVISANVDKLSNMAKQGDVDKEQLHVIIEKTKGDAARMKKYVVENIGEIKE